MPDYIDGMIEDLEDAKGHPDPAVVRELVVKYLNEAAPMLRGNGAPAPASARQAAAMVLKLALALVQSELPDAEKV